MNKTVDWRGLDFRVDLLDIQQLNDRLFVGDFDVAKTSFHAALKLTQETIVLPSGAALGYQVGPLLLAAHPDTQPVDSTQLTLCPGGDTTAALLFRLFHQDVTQVRHVIFSDIMPALEKQEADFGVCIHEGRFTWEQAGLSFVEDLGTRWETVTDCPLPLGGIVARRSLPSHVIADVQAVIHDSLSLALADPDAALPSMRRYAQELDDRVLLKHVELYVNEWTVDLGQAGRKALDELSARAGDAGICEPSVNKLEVFDATS